MPRKNRLTKPKQTRKILSRAKRNTHGDVAQLGEHHVRNVGVVGSNPIISTMETSSRQLSGGSFYADLLKGPSEKRKAVGNGKAVFTGGLLSLSCRNDDIKESYGRSESSAVRQRWDVG